MWLLKEILLIMGRNVVVINNYYLVYNYWNQNYVNAVPVSAMIGALNHVIKKYNP